MWILDREIRRTRPEYRRAYHLCLLAVPVCLGLIWWNLAAAPDLLGDDLLTLRIREHSGASMLAGISSHCLVATHTFLEAVHYGVWLIAIPWLGSRTNLWNVPKMPLGRRSLTWTLALQIFLVVSAAVVVVLWLAFLADYPVTRDVYFTLAMVHVLAEVPFLLRALMREYLDHLQNPWIMLIVGYLFTITIETPILCVGLSPEHPLSRRIFAGLWLTACTYPLVILVAPVFFDPTKERGLYLLIAESIAHLGECALFYAAFGPLKQMWRDTSVVFGANLASFGLGEAMWYVLFGSV